MTRVDLDPAKWLDMPVLAQKMHRQLANEGILLASLDAEGKLNPMTIGWGVFGWIWGKPIYTVLVRPSRYTNDCIERTNDFTVNIQPPDRKDIAEFCGTSSGRQQDKLKKLELATLPSKHIKSPGIAGCPLIFECQVVHKTEVMPPELTDEIKERYYPDGDYHRIYFGQMMNVSVEEKFLESCS